MTFPKIPLFKWIPHENKRKEFSLKYKRDF